MDEKIEKIIAGAIIGAGVSAMFTGKKEAVILSALAGAAIAASVEGFENAKKTNIPVLIKEGDSLVEVQPDGSKREIRKLSKTETAVPKKFKLS